MASAYIEEEFLRVTWVPVESSNLLKVGYTDGLGFLWVLFDADPGEPNRAYVYHSVPRAVFEGLLAAPSKGQYLNKHVKQGQYGYERVR